MGDALLIALLVQLLQHPAQDAPDPYRAWRSPGGRLCCGSFDCVPAQACGVNDGFGFRLGWMELGRCWPLPEEARVLAPPEVWNQAGQHVVHVCRQLQWTETPDGTTPSMKVHCWDAALGS